jgi:hypothetical protein
MLCCQCSFSKKLLCLFGLNVNGVAGCWYALNARCDLTRTIQKPGWSSKAEELPPALSTKVRRVRYFDPSLLGSLGESLGQETGRNELSLNMETQASCRDIGFIDLRITCTLAGFVHYFGGNPPMNNQQSLLVQGWYYPEGMVFRHNTAVEFQITMKSSIRAECQSVVYIHTGVTPVFLCDSG